MGGTSECTSGPEVGHGQAAGRETVLSPHDSAGSSPGWALWSGVLESLGHVAGSSRKGVDGDQFSSASQRKNS